MTSQQELTWAKAKDAIVVGLLFGDLGDPCGEERLVDQRPLRNGQDM